jgi:hypothetical protein
MEKIDFLLGTWISHGFAEDGKTGPLTPHGHPKIENRYH